MNAADGKICHVSYLSVCRFNLEICHELQQMLPNSKKEGEYISLNVVGNLYLDHSRQLTSAESLLC